MTLLFPGWLHIKGLPDIIPNRNLQALFAITTSILLAVILQRIMFLVSRAYGIIKKTKN